MTRARAWAAVATAVLALAVLGGLLPRVTGPRTPTATVSPADDSRLRSAPAAVSLTVDGPVDPAGTHLSVTGPDGRPAATLAPSVDGDVVTQRMSIRTPGGYRVAYHVTLRDGRSTFGESTFDVGQVGGTDAAAPDPAAAGDHRHDRMTGLDLALLTLDALLVAVVLVVLIRGPRRRTRSETLDRSGKDHR
jgi:methionine-rich copper-binding protein CopC